MVLVAVMIGYLINYIPGAGWLNFIAKGSCYTLVYGVLTFYLGANVFEKQLFKESFTPLLRRLKRNG